MYPFVGMTNDELLREMSSLSDAARRQIEKYIAYLKQKEAEKPKVARKRSLREEPFFGMWADREDMKDSTAWVRKTRREQWTRNR